MSAELTDSGCLPINRPGHWMSAELSPRKMDGDDSPPKERRATPEQSEDTKTQNTAQDSSSSHKVVSKGVVPKCHTKKKVPQEWTDRGWEQYDDDPCNELYHGLRQCLKDLKQVRAENHHYEKTRKRVIAELAEEKAERNRLARELQVEKRKRWKLEDLMFKYGLRHMVPNPEEWSRILDDEESESSK